MMKLVPIVASLLFAVACGNDYEISEEPLAGVVGGQEWNFVAGHTNAFLSEGEDDFFATLYPESFEECGFGEPSGNKLILSIPKEPGTYDFSLNRNMTFYVADTSDNLIATNGQIKVDEVTATNIRGGLVGDFDGDNEVNGQFDVTICAGE